MKKLNIKALLIDHGEKIAFGFFALITLCILGMGTVWGRYEKSPDELKREIDNARNKFTSPDNVWPKEKAESFKLVDFTDKARQMFSTPQLAKYDFSIPIFYPLYKKNEPKKEPKYEPVLGLIAKVGFAPIAVLTEEARKQRAEAESEAASESMEPEESSDEFAVQPSTTTAATEKEKPNRPGNRRGSKSAVISGGPAGNTKGSPGAGGHSGPGGARPKGATPGGSGMFMPPGSGASVGMSAPDGGGLGMAGMSGMSGMSSGGTVRGIRFISVRGVFPLRQQLKNFEMALQMQPNEVQDLFEILNFVLERQTAKAGPEPWKDSKWDVVDVKSGIELIEECAETDLNDPVPLALQDPVISMQLPKNLLQAWRQEYASHPKIKDDELNEEGIEAQAKLLEGLDKAQKEAKLQDAQQAPTRRGLAPAQRDIRAAANVVKGSAAATSSMMNIMQSMGSSGAAGGPRGGHSGPRGGGGHSAPPGGGGGDGPGMGIGPRGGRGANAGAHAGGGMQAAMMSAMQRASGMGAGGAAGRGGSPLDVLTVRKNYILFRYFDVDVQPGMAYRYRVRLVLKNPNYERPAEEMGGADPEIAKGLERETPWSNISNPEIVKPTTNYFLREIERDPYTEDKVRPTRPVASLAMYDWDTKIGAVVNDLVNIKAIGEFIGEVKKQAIVPDLLAGTVSKKEDKVAHTFTTQDILLDVDEDLRVALDQHPDLKMTAEKGHNEFALGLPEKALVTTSLGDLKILSKPLGEYEAKDEEYWRKRKDGERSLLSERSKAAPTMGGGEGMGGGAAAGMRDMMKYMQSRGGAGGGNNPGNAASGRGGNLLRPQRGPGGGRGGKAREGGGS